MRPLSYCWFFSQKNGSAKATRGSMVSSLMAKTNRELGGHLKEKWVLIIWL